RRPAARPGIAGAGAVRVERDVEERHGFPGTPRALGGSRGVTGFPGRPERWGVWGAISGPPMKSVLPVEVAAAALAEHEAGRRAQLLDGLRADAHAAAAADRRRRYRGHRDAAARLEDAVVAREHPGRQLLRARLALRAHDLEL